MVQYNVSEEETGTPIPSSRWTTKRVRLAGLAGMISGIGLLALEIPYHLYTTIETEGTLEFTVYNLGLALLLALSAIAILGAHAMYSDRYGRIGRLGVYGLSGAFALISIGIASYALAPEVDPLGPVADVAFFAMLLLMSAVGVLFWRKTGMNRVAAGLMGAVVPMFILAIALAENTGVVPEWLAVMVFLLPLSLGLAALGYHLWANAAGIIEPTFAASEGI